MEREIKFRAWDKATKRIIAEGFHVIGEVTMFGMIEMYLSEHQCGKSSSLQRMNDVVLMQYTGLKDRNGKEIYEGDVMTHPEFKKGAILEVCWRDGYYALSDWDCVRTDFGKGEVIGNIYENPKLVEEKP